jgi:hypothetical protein
MKTTVFFLLGNFLLTAIFTSFAYLEKSIWIGTTLTIILAVLWGLSQLLEYRFLPGLFFLMFSIICLVGTFLGLRSILLFLGMTAALNTWDTDRFYRRWKAALEREPNKNLEWKHIFRLLIVDGSAIGVAIIGLSIKTQLSFGLMLLVVIIALISLSQLIRLLRNSRSKV